MDQVAQQFAFSLASLNKTYETRVAFLPGSLVYDSRNRLCKVAVKEGADIVMWVDSDMVFQPDTLDRLIEDLKDHDIVSGLCFRRRPPYDPVIIKDVDLEHTSTEAYVDYPEDELFEIEACGFGLVAMKADVIWDLALKEKDWFTPTMNFGEDYSFCIRAKRQGWKIWCDPKIKVGHVGNVVIDETFWKAYRQKNDSTTKD